MGISPQMPAGLCARLMLALGSALIGTSALAVQYESGVLGGMMLQPTSSYYHAIYGAYAGIGGDKETVIGRLGYVERPRFAAAGFVDQESMWFAMVGTKLTKATWHGLYAFVGAGEVRGYVKLDGKAAAALATSANDYRLGGLVLAAEYQAEFGPARFAIGHQTLVGHVNQRQLEAYVAWPYNFFMLKAGVSL